MNHIKYIIIYIYIIIIYKEFCEYLCEKMNILGDNIERAYSELIYDEWKRHRDCINKLTQILCKKKNEIICNTISYPMTCEEGKKFRNKMAEIEKDYRNNFDKKAKN